MKRYILSIYLALILTISLSIAFISTLQLYFEYEGNEMRNQGLPVSFAVKIEPGQNDGIPEQISKVIGAIDGIVSTQPVLSIPAWQGNPAKEEQWKEMWKAYLSPIVYATAEMQVKNYKDMQKIADQIRSVTGVTALAWDKESQLDKENRLKEQSDKKVFFISFAGIGLVLVVLGLLYSYPVRLRRQYVVRTGVGGAGAQVNPEKIWGFMVLSHIIASVLCYSIVFSVSYWRLPFSLNSEEYSGFMTLFFQGLLMTVGIVTGICLIGWWLKADEVQEIHISRPPMAGWDQE